MLHETMRTTTYTACRTLSLLLALLVGACTSSSRTAGPDVDLVDPDATDETRALFANLDALSADHVLFGHQDDLAYGVTWKREEGRSDVRETAGSYPAVYGWELGDLGGGADQNLDGVRFDDMQRWIKEGYRRGGVITISWHMDNPVSGGDAWDTTRAVPAILPGGDRHDAYKRRLDRFADFVQGLKVGPFTWLGFGKPVPIIFRPFHEMSGFWFWWGDASTTPEEYKALWRFTVEYLRDEKGLHNLLYAYSPDVVEDEEEYLTYYPGDDYVDILGYDDYHTLGREGGVSALAAQLRRLVEIARERNKIAAFTETGAEGVEDPNWFTGRLLAAIEADPVGQQIAYVLVWRNANRDDIPGHFYAPHDGHPAAEDFRAFRQDPMVLFEDDLPDLYEIP